jgi:hypothetical protein
MSVFGQASSSSEAVSRPSLDRPASIRTQSATSSPLVGKLRGINGNSLLARRYREVAMAIADDCGGADRLSEPTKILVRQAAALTVQVEGLQSKIVAGEEVDLEQLTRLTNSLSRMLHRLGLKKPQSRQPTLAERLGMAPSR